MASNQAITPRILSIECLQCTENYLSKSFGISPMMASDDYYAALGLPLTANSDEIKTAYRRMAKKTHPDKNPEDKQATANFQKINLAYSILSDPEKRRVYDLKYRYPNGTSSTAGGTSRPSAETPNYGTWSHRSSVPLWETYQMREHRQRREEAEKRLEELYQQSSTFERDIYQLKRKLKEREDTLKSLKATDLKDESDEASRRGWFGFLWRLTPEQQEERDRNATARKTGMLVVEAQVKHQKEVLELKESILSSLRIRMRSASEDKDMAANQYNLLLAAEQRRRQEEQHRKSAQAQAEKNRQEQAAREADLRQKREAAAEAERTRREKDAQNAEEAARRFRQAYEASRSKSQAQTGNKARGNKEWGQGSKSDQEPVITVLSTESFLFEVHPRRLSAKIATKLAEIDYVPANATRISGSVRKVLRIPSNNIRAELDRAVKGVGERRDESLRVKAQSSVALTYFRKLVQDSAKQKTAVEGLELEAYSQA